MRLKNCTRPARTVSFTLAHKVVCSGGECLCTLGEHKSRAYNPKTGDVGIRTVSRLIASSAFLMPGEDREMPEAARKLPEVAAMLDRGELRAV